MFKEIDTIYLLNADNEDIILATKKDHIWQCDLCDENEYNKVRMLTHIRFHHILVK